MEVEIRLDDIDNTVIQRDLVDYVIILKQNFGNNFKKLAKDTARKFSVQLSTLLLPLNTLYNELTNSTPNQIQGQVLGNKLKNNLVDLQSTNNKINQDIMAFQTTVQELQVSQHTPSTGALVLLGGTS